MAYIGNSPGVASQRVVTNITATAGQTVFTPISGYTLGYVEVYQNGLLLVSGTDYTADDGQDITFSQGANLDDDIQIVAYKPRGLTDGYTKAEADARYEPLDSAYTKAESDSRYTTTSYVDTAVGNVTTDLVGDATPQLGGNLDLNSNDITGTGNINVTGTVTADGLTLSSASSPNLNITDTTNTVTTQIASTDTQGFIGTTTNHQFQIVSNGTKRLRIESNGDISFYEDTGTTPKLFWDASAESLGIGTTSPSYNVDIQDSSTPVMRLKRGTTDTDLRVAAYGVNTGGLIGTYTNSPLLIYTNSAEAMRIDSSGRLLINNTTLTDGYLNVVGDGITNNAIYVQQNNSTSKALYSNCTASSFSNIVGLQYATRANTSAYFFHRSYSSAGSDQEFYVRGDGQVGADGSFFGGGADYAEYFEWSDANASNEDRRGYTVVLDGNKVRKATDEDDASQIIGAVSSRPSVVGDADMDAWKDKYLRDEFGSYITETHNVIEWTEQELVEEAQDAVLDEEGNIIEEAKEAVYKDEQYSYEDWNIPEGIAVPDDATVLTQDENGNPFTHRKLNPDYDESLAYVAREDRPEWDAIGMMGKLRIRTGQPVGDRWIKMRDISETVEEWLVR